jgi:hypothetical protein
MKKFLAVLALALAIPLIPGGRATAECTIGVANGIVTEDGRPLLWKSRMWSGDNNHVAYFEGPVYEFLGIKCLSDTNALMGLNTAGLCTGNSLVGPSGGNGAFMTYILGHFATVSEVRQYIYDQLDAHTLRASGCFPFMDALGNTVMFEIYQSNWVYEYDCLDPDRIPQGLYGWIVRANEWHQNADGTDDTNIGGRYESGCYNIAGLIELGVLSAFTIMQGNDGANGFEFMRYGPNRPPYATIADPSVCSSMIVHGVALGENPGLSTMWTALGHPNYAIAVPTWTAVSDVPPSLATGDLAGHANSLRNDGLETLTQSRVFPAEAHLFNEVDELLAAWRAARVPPWDDMERVEWRMAADGHSLLHCLDLVQNDNYAPSVKINMADQSTYIRIYGHKIAIDDLSIVVPPAIYYEDSFATNQVERDSYDHSYIRNEMPPWPAGPYLFFTRTPSMRHALGFMEYLGEYAHLAYRFPIWPAPSAQPAAVKFVMEPLSAAGAGSYSLSTDGWNWSRLRPLTRGINYIGLWAGSAGPSRYFVADAADADGTIASYLWDFGDGETSADQNVWHMFPDTGTYLISCTVTDDDGVSTTDWKYISVTCPW